MPRLLEALVVTLLTAFLVSLLASSNDDLKYRPPDMANLNVSGTADVAPAMSILATRFLLGLSTALPEIKPQNAAQFMAAGGDPRLQPISDEFRCYQIKQTHSLTPELALQILPGGQYRSTYGSGDFTRKVTEDENLGSIIKLDWTGGLLDGASGYLHFENEGQRIYLFNVGVGVWEKALNFECYQRGPRENLNLLYFKLKTPPPGRYYCGFGYFSIENGTVLDLLADGRFRYNNKGGGSYSYDLRSNLNDGWSRLNFAGGGLGGYSGSYRENRQGWREITVHGPGVICAIRAQPTPLPQYGAAKAPPAPTGSGGLSGAYARASTDPLAGTRFSTCGGVCWDLRIFDPSGYVFTQEPEASLDEADCTRTHPNGLPVCETYRLQDGTLTIGNGPPETFDKMGDALKIGGLLYRPVVTLEGIKLDGYYSARSLTKRLVDSTNTIRDDVSFLSLLPDQRFDRADDWESSPLAAEFDAIANSDGSTTGFLESPNRGGYTLEGNTLELTYGDGHQERLFAFAVLDKDRQVSVEVLRLGGVSYTKFKSYTYTKSNWNPGSDVDSR